MIVCVCDEIIRLHVEFKKEYDKNPKCVVISKKYEQQLFLELSQGTNSREVAKDIFDTINNDLFQIYGLWAFISEREDFDVVVF